jgi:Protein of unknown function (DUF1580)
MPIDLTNEQALSLTEASKALPPIDGRRPHPSTIFRWCKNGLRGVHLEFVRIGNRVCTSREALSRFANRLAEVDSERCASPVAPPKTTTRTNRQRERSVARAENVLRAGGIL